MARPGPGKGWRSDQPLGQAQLAAQRAHLVLEQLAQGLDQLQLHALGQAADIVVRLDGDAGAAGEAHALDHVGIERALRQELGAADLVRLGVEHVDEGGADDLALAARDPSTPASLPRKSRARVAMDQRDVVMVAEERHHLLRLARAQQPVIDEDAGELLADRLVQQRRRDRAVDAARQAADDAAAADLRPDALDRLGAEGGHASSRRGSRRRDG